MEPLRAWSFDDFEAGQVFTGQGRTITESDIVWFANWSWDTNPPHTDAVHMASSQFGERIANGLLGMSVAMGLASRLGVFEACSIALLGVDDWRFHAPVVVGDTLRVRITILATRVTSAGVSGVLERRFELINQRTEVVQSGSIPLLVGRR